MLLYIINTFAIILLILW